MAHFRCLALLSFLFPYNLYWHHSITRLFCIVPVVPDCIRECLMIDKLQQDFASGGVGSCACLKVRILLLA